MLLSNPNGERARKGLSVTQAYSKMFWEERDLKKICRQRFEEAKRTALANELPEPSELKIRNEMLKELYDAAGEDEKAAVEDFRKAFKEDIVENASKLKEELDKSPDMRSPVALQRLVAWLNKQNSQAYTASVLLTPAILPFSPGSTPLHIGQVTMFS